MFNRDRYEQPSSGLSDLVLVFIYIPIAIFIALLFATTFLLAITFRLTTDLIILPTYGFIKKWFSF